MPDVRPLLNRRPLLPNESLPSLFIRLRDANYYWDKGAIISLCLSHLRSNENVCHPQTPDAWRVIQAVTQLPFPHIHLATFHRYALVLHFPPEPAEYLTLPDKTMLPLASGYSKRTYLLPLENAQFCPSCLAAGRYHQVHWLSSLVGMCPQHDCLMQHGCPACAEKLNIDAIMAGLCPKCRFDLTETTAVSVGSQWDRWVQKVITSWLNNTPISLPPEPCTLPDQPLPVLLEMMLCLARCALRLLEPERSNYKWPFTPAHRVQGCGMAMKALTDWPQGFHQFLETYRRRPSAVPEKITSEFSLLYPECLENRWKHPEFKFVQEAFNDFLSANYRISRSIIHLDRFQRDQTWRDRFPYLMQLEAAERLGVGERLIEQLVATEILVDYERGEDVELHWHKRLKLVRRKEYVALQKRWQVGVSILEIAHLLDVPVDVVHSLVQSQLLLPHAPAGEETSVRIGVASLHEFFCALHRCYPHISSTLDETVSLRELTAEGRDLLSILNHVVNEEVASVWFKGGLYDLEVSQKARQLVPRS